ncbi:MAG TPA: hypothetical protein ENN84_06695, partial [Candidatus Marinimicrobia bacterium]|nr:hypothetical protein [Candidatus Neomarinimicrobiota bacterium]
MKLSTYIGESLQDAMRQAKAELGDEVVLLESRELTGKGLIDPNDRNRVQITVTVTETYDNPKRVRAVPPKEILTEPVQPAAANPFTEILKAREDLARQKRLDADFSSRQEKEPAGGMANEIAVLRHELNKLNLSLRRMIAPEFPEKFSRLYEKLLEAGLANEDANA